MNFLALMIQPDHNSSGFFVIVFVCGLIVWLLTLISVIRSRDMKDADRIIWVVILCTLNVLGLLLYWIIAPSNRVRSDRELKEYFNSREDHPEQKD